MVMKMFCDKCKKEIESHWEVQIEKVEDGMFVKGKSDRYELCSKCIKKSVKI